jgi:hypothetical protein
MLHRLLNLWDGLPSGFYIGITVVHQAKPGFETIAGAKNKRRSGTGSSMDRTQSLLCPINPTRWKLSKHIIFN